MRIGVVFPSIYASLRLFPDKIFAPRELCIDLVNGLVRHGHDVTVYSVPDFPTQATLISEPVDTIATPREYHKFRHMSQGDRSPVEHEYAKHQFELRLFTRAFRDAQNGKFDVLHVYHDSSLFLSHYVQQFLPHMPVCYTLHDPLAPEGTYEYEEFTRHAGHNYVAISDSFRRSALQIHFVDTVYHGIDTTLYPYNDSPSDSFLFLGRLVKEKGLHTALAASRITGDSLIVSTNFPGEGEKNDYYEELTESLHLPTVKRIGVVDKPGRIELYRQAKALLFPIEWEEPFGIVLIEAMACGTPVIAFNRGSVPEIVKDGVTGFIITPDDSHTESSGQLAIQKRGTDGIVEAMQRIGEIERKSCVKHVQDTFSVDHMIRGYERVYKSIRDSIFQQ